MVAHTKDDIHGMTTILLYLADGLGSLIVNGALLDGLQRIIIRHRLCGTVLDDKVLCKILEIQHQSQWRAQQHGRALVIHLITRLSTLIIDSHHEVSVRTCYLFLKSLC